MKIRVEFELQEQDRIILEGLCKIQGFRLSDMLTGFITKEIKEDFKEDLNMDIRNIKVSLVK